MFIPIPHDLSLLPILICGHISLRKRAIKNLIQTVSQTPFFEYQSTIPDSSWDKVIDDTYVLHYSKAQYRRQHMIKFLDQMRMRALFVNSYDKEELVNLDIKNVVINPLESEFEFRPTMQRQLTPGETSLSLKTCAALIDILKRNRKNALILEDDSVLEKFSSAALFKNILGHKNEDYSVIMVVLTTIVLPSAQFDQLLYQN